jgi:hypothetical protein
MGVGTNGVWGRHIRIHEPETTSGGLWSPDVTKQVPRIGWRELFATQFVARTSTPARLRVSEKQDPLKDI